MMNMWNTNKMCFGWLLTTRSVSVCHVRHWKIIIQDVAVWSPINKADGDIGAAIFPFMLVSVPPHTSCRQNEAV